MPRYSLDIYCKLCKYIFDINSKKGESNVQCIKLCIFINNQIQIVYMEENS